MEKPTLYQILVEVTRLVRSRFPTTGVSAVAVHLFVDQATFDHTREDNPESLEPDLLMEDTLRVVAGPYELVVYPPHPEDESSPEREMELDD